MALFTDPPTETETRVCPEHGEYAAKRLVLGRGPLPWSRCRACAEAERTAILAKQIEDAARDRLESRVAACGIPKRFADKTLDAFVADTEAKRYAVTVARDYIQGFDAALRRGDGLIFSGLPGTGKSHIAAVILREAMRTTDGLYLTCMGAIRAVRSTWRKDSDRSESDVLDELGSVGLLVLDEIGVQYGTDGEQTIVFDILDRRYRDMKPTILLTNQDKEGLKQFIGERTYDRLTETCRWVPFDWPSYRTTARREAQQS